MISTYSLFVIIAVLCTSCGSNQNSGSDEIKDSLVRVSFPEDQHFVNSIDTINTTGPNTITRDVLVDHNGITWLASWQGLYSYNGNEFTNVTLREGWPHERVFSLLEDRKGNMWFGTLGAGVYCYDGKRYTNYSTANGLICDTVECMFEDEDGRLWFGTPAGASMYDGKTFMNLNSSDGLTNVHTISQDAAGRMWFGADDGAFRLYGNFVSPYYWDDSTAFNNVRALYRDKKGTMWIGGQNGLFKTVNDSECVEVYSMFISYIREGRDDTLLISSDESEVAKSQPKGMALWKYDGARRYDLSLKNGTGDNQIFGSAIDGDGNVLFGTMNGLCWTDGKEEKCFAQ